MSGFASAGAVLSDSWTTVYESPNTAAIVLLAQVVSIDTGAEVDVQWVDGTDEHYLVKGLAIPEGEFASVTDGRLVLPADASIRARATSSDTAEMTVSALEDPQ